MTGKIIAAIKPDVSTLSFIERYGELTRPLPKLIEGKKLFYPVSTSVDAAKCWEEGKYKRLVPNSDYYSVSYWEERTALRTIRNGQISKNFLTKVQTVRFVSWINLAKLGFSDDSKIGEMEAEAESVICQAKKIQIGNNEGAFEFRNPVRLDYDPKKVFDRYFYKDEAHLFIYPYAFFAIEFDLEIIYNKNCQPAVNRGVEIQCITEW